MRQLHEWGAGPFRIGAVVLAPRTFVAQVCRSYTDGAGISFKMKVLCSCRALSLQTLVTFIGVGAASFHCGALA
eukprot:7835002-Pyramimonas_sp.AAC.1